VADTEEIERFTGLYDRYHQAVYSYAIGRVGLQLADEVLSEVFLVTWRKLSKVPDDPLPWLLVVARNVISSEFRASARQQSLAAELESWTAAAEPDIADEVSERHTVLRALAALSDADREILTLVAWHGLTPGEAAQVTGCSTATYFVRLHRARRRLERAMSAEPEPRTLTASQGERQPQ
jgi:RNA polymerase sigma-70 factor, ECF subfamily